MSLLARVALLGGVLLALTVLVATVLWKPAAEAAFVARTDGLLDEAERDFGTVATSLVDGVMEFSAEAGLAADEKRALAVRDLPFELYTDGEGRLDPRLLREAVRIAATDPAASAAEKHNAVRAEVLDRTAEDVAARLAALRSAQRTAAARHGEEAAWRTVAAWAGMMLLFLAAWAFLLDRFVLQPLRDATAAVARFGAGERGVRLDPHGTKELAALERAFNVTAEAVERAERENTELRDRLEEKVRERTQALVRAARASTAGTMAGGVAHEFNNLLSGILGCADAGLAEGPGPEVKEILAMIRKTAGRGVGITDALLRATRAEPARDDCDAAAILEEAVEEVRPPPAVAVTRQCAPAPLRADAAMLRQVFANLVRNAVEAMGGAGALTLVARPEGDMGARVEVADTGPGIPAAVREILFEPFVTTRAGGREGAGLGLFLADRLVQAHGGRLEAHDEPGGGTRFVVDLPPSARDS